LLATSDLCRTSKKTAIPKHFFDTIETIGENYQTIKAYQADGICVVNVM